MSPIIWVIEDFQEYDPFCPKCFWMSFRFVPVIWNKFMSHLLWKWYVDFRVHFLIHPTHPVIIERFSFDVTLKWLLIWKFSISTPFYWIFFVNASLSAWKNYCRSKKAYNGGSLVICISLKRFLDLYFKV